MYVLEGRDLSVQMRRLIGAFNFAERIVWVGDSGQVEQMCILT